MATLATYLRLISAGILLIVCLSILQSCAANFEASKIKFEGIFDPVGTLQAARATAVTTEKTTTETKVEK